MFDQVEQDAAFIVRACNAHEELVEALKVAMEWAEADGAQSDYLWYEAAEKAIAKAEGRG